MPTLTDGPDLALWESFLNRFGLPLVLVGLIVFAAFRFSRWFGPLIERLIDAIIGFITGLSGRLDQIEKDGAESREILKRIEKALSHKRNGGE